MARLTRERQEVETALTQPSGDYAELGRRLAHVSAEVAQLEERWLELQSELEAMQASG